MFDLPKENELWPCQTHINRRSLGDEGGAPYRQVNGEGDVVPERLVAFLYRLLRDGAMGPGAVEDHMLAVRVHQGQGIAFTNPGLEENARRLASFLMQVEALPPDA